MKYIHKTKLKKAVSGILAASMSVSLFTTIPVSAEIGTTTYTYDGCTIEYNVTGEWDNTQNISLTLTNTGEDPILNWAMKYDAGGEISNIWNAGIYSENGDEYVIKNVGWNFEITPNQSVTYGYTLSGNDLSLPESFEICSKRVDKTEGYDIQYNITKSWETGVEGDIVITNTSDAPIEAWTLSFDSNFTIDNLWNGRVLENNGTSYTAAAEVWTNPVQPNSSMAIGFVGSKAADIEAILSNFRLTEVVIGGGIPVTPVDPPAEEIKISANAKYTQESGNISVSWTSDKQDGTFDILMSEDGENFVSVGTVANVSEYVYTPENNFETLYFKVVQTVGEQTAESNVVTVNISEIVLAVITSANYDEETGNIKVSWITGLDRGTYEVFVSEDNEIFTSLGILENTKEYIYTPAGEFEVLYFKVKQTVGELTAESESAAAYYPIDWEDETDTDNDGLTDVYEKYYFETDPTNPDTDSDGLSDGYEVYYLGTDPQKADSDDNGISDADEDFDKDGLTNMTENTLGTDPRDDDSDDDSLTDDDEVHIYGTDPHKYDTDSDNISDGDEVKLGLDPNNAATNGVPDNELTFAQTIPADDWLFYNINTENNPFDFSIEITAAGVAVNNIEASFSGYSYSLKNDAILGNIPEFSYNENLKIDNIKINFDLDKNVADSYNDKNDYIFEELSGIKRFNVFKYFEDINMLLPIETFHDESANRVYAHTTETGTYCLMDMVVWLESIGIKAENEVGIQSYSVNGQIEQTEITGNIPDKKNSPTAYIQPNGKYQVIYLIGTNGTPNDESLMYIKDYVIYDARSYMERSNPVCIYVLDCDGNIITTDSGKEYADTDEELLQIINRIELKHLNSDEFQIKVNRVCDKGRDISKDISFWMSIFGVDSYEFIMNCSKSYTYPYSDDEPMRKIDFWYAGGVSPGRNVRILAADPNELENNKARTVLTATRLTRLPDDFGSISVLNTDDYDNDGLSNNAEIDWQSPLIINGKPPTLDQCIAYAGNYGKITYVEQGLRCLQSLPENIYSELLKINILPIKSDPISPDGDGDGIADDVEYEIMFVDELNARSNNNINKALYQNSIIDMYGFKTDITGVMKKRGNINPAYSLASEKNITTKGNKNYGYLGSYNDVFFLEAFCERDSEGKVKANELRINANLRFYEDELKLISSIDSDGNKIYDTDTVTKDEIIRAIEDEWKMEIKGDLYDFFGMNVKVVTVIHEFGENYKPQKYSKIHLKDESKNPTTSLSTFDEIKNVKIYNQKLSKILTKDKILNSCAHEFGHILALADLYGANNRFNYYIQPVTYKNMSEISFIPNAKLGDKDSKSMMFKSGKVNANEIEMVIYAAKERRTQFFVPMGYVKDKTDEFSLSKAIRLKYFYLCKQKSLKFNSGDYLIYTGNEYQNVKGKNVEDLYSFFILNQNDYKEIYKKCYNSCDDNIIVQKYKEYYDERKEYVDKVYKYANSSEGNK